MVTNVAVSCPFLRKTPDIAEIRTLPPFQYARRTLAHALDFAIVVVAAMVGEAAKFTVASLTPSPMPRINQPMISISP
jgi:hypothetical protein